MQHSRSGKHDHRPGIIGVTSIERFDVFKLEHIALNERVFNFLISPRDEHLIEIVGLFRESQGEVDGRLKVHSFPVGFEEDAEFLSAAQGENGNQN